MKKKSLNILISLFVLLIISNISFSQEIIDIPQFGTNISLNRFIMSDTLASGERAHPNAIYRLARGEYYEIDHKMNINFNITLMADSEPHYKRPPMISSSLDAQGRNISPLFEIKGDSNYFKTKNIIYNGVRDDNNVLVESGSLFSISGSYHRIEVDSCIFTGWNGSVLKSVDADRMVCIWTNNIFRNGVHFASPWRGTIYSMPTTTTHQDTIKFVNNTFFNISSYQLLSWEFVDYIEYEHNTIFVSTLNSHCVPYLQNAKFNNNIFFNYQVFGQTQYEIDNGFWDQDTNSNQKSSICKLSLIDPQILSNNGMTEADRNVEYKNNIYAWSQEVKDYWLNYKDSSTNVELDIMPILWMNNYTQAMFDDADSYPNLVEENNLELDPGFDAKLVETILAKEMLFVKFIRKYHICTIGFAMNRHYAPDGNYWDIAWPLPEKLTYTNKTAMTHAQGSFPVGDLNWYDKSVMAKWNAYRNGYVGVESDNENLPSAYNLSQNYPNPFNPTTEINFSIPVAGNTKLEVYNILGQKVATLVNKKLNAGSHKYQFDASNLSSGLYVYRLQSNNFISTKKMMLLK